MDIRPELVRARLTIDNGEGSPFVTPVGVMCIKSSKAPVLFGITEVKLDLASQPVIVNECRTPAPDH